MAEPARRRSVTVWSPLLGLVHLGLRRHGRFSGGEDGEISLLDRETDPVARRHLSAPGLLFGGVGLAQIKKTLSPGEEVDVRPQAGAVRPRVVRQGDDLSVLDPRSPVVRGKAARSPGRDREAGKRTTRTRNGPAPGSSESALRPGSHPARSGRPRTALPQGRSAATTSRVRRLREHPPASRERVGSRPLAREARERQPRAARAKRGRCGRAIAVEAGSPASPLFVIRPVSRIASGLEFRLAFRTIRRRSAGFASPERAVRSSFSTLPSRSGSRDAHARRCRTRA